APFGEQVDGRELLEQAHRIRRAQDRYRAGESDASSACRRGGQDDRRGRVKKLALVVLADSEYVQTHPVGVFDALEQLAHPVYRSHCEARLVKTSGETIDSYLHDGLPGIDRWGRIRLYGLEFDFDRGRVADKEAAGLECHIPIETEVFPIDFCPDRETRDRLAHRARAGAVELHVERDLACLPVDGEVACDGEMRAWAGNPPTLECDRGIVRYVEEIG